MKILMLGGKRFAGYHMVEAALKRGHEIVLFNRGKTSPELFPELETVIGDREHDLHLLDDMQFDAVLDTSCYLPRHMKISAEYFKDRVKRYLFISTASVYDLSVMWLSEQTPTVTPLPDAEIVSGETYGGMKAASERYARDAFGDRLTTLRPGYICGYRDNTDRMSYWPIKMHYLDKILVPDYDFDFQLVDARDLAEFSIKLLEDDVGGDFNVTGPVEPIKFSQFLEECRKVANPKCEIIRLSAEKLRELELYEPHPSVYFPLATDGIAQYAGIYNIDVRKAVNAGLTFRPVADTIRGALDWHLESAKDEDDVAAGLKTSKEREIIAKL